MTDPASQPTLDNLLSEDAPVPAERASSRLRRTRTAELYAWAKADRLELLGASRPGRCCAGTRPFTEVLDWSGAPVARWFADGTAQRVRQRRRPPRRGRPRRSGRAAVRGRARRHPRRSPTPSSSARSSRAANALARARRDHRRPGRDLPADDPRGRHRDARLRAHRRRALGRVRRLLRRGAALPDRRRLGAPW